MTEYFVILVKDSTTDLDREQWRTQDFLHDEVGGGGTNRQGVGAILLFDQIFLENCMKKKTKKTWDTEAGVTFSFNPRPFSYAPGVTENGKIDFVCPGGIMISISLCPQLISIAPLHKSPSKTVMETPPL